MPRQARLDAPGTLHHVIVRGIERRQIVNDHCDRSDFVSRMGKIAAETARHLGVSTSAIAKVLERIKSKSN
jgi:REP element-mobilizing transposase RayT